MDKLRRRLLQAVAAAPLRGRLWVAYSGGLDSHVLLHLAAALRGELAPLELRAAHIHHGLHPEADAWAEHCQRVCAALAIPCAVLRVDACAAPGESLEAAARAARYAALAGCLAGGEGMLAAQHGDDQAETVLLQLLRGAGPAGLAAMPALARLGPGWLLRPLLDFTRAELRAYARAEKLAWIEDSSNQDTRFDRNFLRHCAVPALRSRWPALARTLTRAAAHQAQAAHLLEELGEIDRQQCAAPLPPLLAALFPAARPLSISAARALSPARRDNLLRRWLAGHGAGSDKLSQRPPGSAHLAEISRSLFEAAEDRQPLVAWPGVEVRRWRDLLLALPPLPPAPGRQVLAWQPPDELILPLGRLRAVPAHGRGLSIPAGAALSLRFRQGGEVWRWRGHRHDLKKLFQTAGVPAWLRDFVPLVYAGEELAAVPGLAVADGFRAEPDETGWELGFLTRTIPCSA